MDIIRQWKRKKNRKKCPRKRNNKRTRKGVREKNDGNNISREKHKK